MEFQRLERVLQAGGVRRFHTTWGIPDQSLAEHQWRVAMIFHHLYHEERAPLPSSGMVHALVHDLGESVVGDLPAPIKWDEPELADLHQSIEDQALQGLIDIGLAWHQEVKMADALELAWFSYDVRRTGNLNADIIFQRIVVHILEELKPKGDEALLLAGLICRYKDIDPRCEAQLEGLEEEALECVK